MRLIVSLLLPLALASTGPGGWPGRPRTDPPKLPQAGPPSAWIETRDRSVWLAFGSYCWTTMCVDMIPPGMRKDLPTITIRRGAPVRVHLAFLPRSAQAYVLRRNQQTPVEIQSKSVLDWRPQLSGVVLIDVKDKRGSAGYLFRLRIRAG